MAILATVLFLHDFTNSQSNYPELSDDEELNVSEHLRDRYYPNVVPGLFCLEYRGACHVMIPLGN